MSLSTNIKKAAHVFVCKCSVGNPSVHISCHIFIKPKYFYCVVYYREYSWSYYITDAPFFCCLLISVHLNLLSWSYNQEILFQFIQLVKASRIILLFLLIWEAFQIVLDSDIMFTRIIEMVTVRVQLHCDITVTKRSGIQIRRYWKYSGLQKIVFERN